MKNTCKILTVLSILTMLLAGCGNTGKLDEGNCPVEVKLEALPQAYQALDDEIREQVYVNVGLQNIINEKTYTFTLNEENGFVQEASLNPGTYRVVSYYMSSAVAVRLELEISQERLEIQEGDTSRLTVKVTNEEELDRWAEEMQVNPAILKEGQFSRIVQFCGQVISLEQIKDYVEFTADKQVLPYRKEEIGNGEAGVYITVLNDTDQTLSWDQCRVIGVRFSKDNVIFGQGVRIHMDASKMLHQADGLYGVPDNLEGCVLIGADYADFNAVYHDAASGDRMTVRVSANGERINGITYEFEVYE